MFKEEILFTQTLPIIRGERLCSYSFHRANIHVIPGQTKALQNYISIASININEKVFKQILEIKSIYKKLSGFIPETHIGFTLKF